MNINTVTYARVSTKDIVDHGTSLATQAEACRTFASAKGWSLASEFHDDLSGVTPLTDRPGLYAAYQLCADDGVGALVVLDVDRLARSTWVGSSIQHEFAELGVTIHFVQGGDTTEPDDTFMVDVKQAFAAHKRLKILERTRRGKLQASRNGKVIAGQAPFGYRLVAGKLEVEDAEAEVVRRIFKLYATDGLSLHGVAAWLDGHGVPTPKGGESWARTSVRKMLMHTAYTGRWAYNRRRRTKVRGRYRGVVRPEDEWIWVVVPSVLDDGLWHSAQGRLAENQASRRRPSRLPTPLHGLVFCANCGRLLSRQYRTKYEYWRCNGRAECGAPTFPGRELEAAVATWAVGLARSRVEFEANLAAANERSAPLVGRLKSVEAEVAELGSAIGRAHEVYVSGAWSKDRYDAEVRKANEKLAAKRAEADPLRADRGQQGALDPAAAMEEWDTVFDELRRLAPRLDKVDPRVDAGVRDSLAGIYRRLNLQATLGTKGKRTTKVAALTCRLSGGSLSFTTS